MGDGSLLMEMVDLWWICVPNCWDSLTFLIELVLYQLGGVEPNTQNSGVAWMLNT